MISLMQHPILSIALHNRTGKWHLLVSYASTFTAVKVHELMIMSIICNLAANLTKKIFSKKISSKLYVLYVGFSVAFKGALIFLSRYFA